MQSINVNQPTIKPDPFKPETTCSDLTTSDFFFISSPLTFTHSTPKIGNLLPQIHSNNKNGSLNQFSNIPKLNLSEGLEQGVPLELHGEVPSDISTPSSSIYSLEESDFSHSSSTAHADVNCNMDHWFVLASQHQNELSRLSARAEELNAACARSTQLAEREEAEALAELQRREREWIVEQKRMHEIRTFTRRTRMKVEDEDYTDSDSPPRRRGRPTKRLVPRGIAGRRTKLPIRAVEVLREAFLQLLPSPFLSEKGKTELMAQTGLNQKQIADWFTNTRKRSYKYFVHMLMEANCNIIDQPRDAVCICSGPIKHSWDDLFQ